MIKGEKMKKKLMASYIMIMTFFFLAGSGKAKPRFSFKLAGGYGTMSTGDLNTVINSINNRLKDLGSAIILSKIGELEELNLGPGFEGEFVINISEKVGIGIGSGYIHRKKNSEAGLKYGTLVSLGVTLESLVVAIPVEISAYYFFPTKSKLNIYLKGGIGYYFGILKYDSKLNAEIATFNVSMRETSGDMRDNAMGFHGGIGFEYDIAKNIGLFVEGAGRYAKLKDWKGDETYIDFEGQTDEISGTLWLCETLNDRTEKYYPSFKVSKNKPSSEAESYRNIRKAEIDFSGFSLRLGLRIKF